MYGGVVAADRRVQTTSVRLALTLPFALAVACAAPTAADPETSAPAPAAAPVHRFDPPYDPVPAGVPDPPRYRPSESSPAPVPITTDAYGAFATAPDAPRLGDKAVDFEVAIASGGTFALADARAAGPVLLMFYRGFW